MVTLDYSESCYCRFQNCEYYNYDEEKCELGMCKNLTKDLKL